MYVQLAPMSNDRQQIGVVDRVAVDINTITTYHQNHIYNTSTTADHR